MSQKTQERTRANDESQRSAPPPLYRVVLLNDDFTPMDYVIRVLETFFSLDREQAMRLMLEVHHKGSAIAGLFSRDLAETKAALVLQDARAHQHPLQCVV